MSSDQVLVFDISGEYGHFRKFNTTTSPLTYCIPPRTAIIGMIGAILGIEREFGVGKYLSGQIPLSDRLSREQANIAVQLLNPVSKVTMAFNLINTKHSFFNIDNRTQIEFELLKNPRFRVFFTCKDPTIYGDLKERIEKKRSHFTVCLGLSQFVADFDLVGEYKLFKGQKDTHVPVISAIKLIGLDHTNPILFDQEFKYLSDTLPVHMNSERLVLEYGEIMIEASGEPIMAKGDNFFNVSSLGNIQFL
jgi:CRISPR-associated protein Cas5h